MHGIGTHAVGLGNLVRLPVVELGLDLLNNSGNIIRAHGRINAHRSAVLNNGRRAVEGLGRAGSTALLSLLALLGSRGEEVIIAVLLADQLGTLQSRVVHSTLGLGRKTAGSNERTLLFLVRGVEELKQAVGSADLLDVGGVASLSEQALGVSLLALENVLLSLGLATLESLVTGLLLVCLEGLLLAIVVVLELSDPPCCP